MDAINIAKRINVCLGSVNEERALTINAPEFDKYKQTRDRRDYNAAVKQYCQNIARSENPVLPNINSAIPTTKNLEINRQKLQAKQQAALAQRQAELIEKKNRTLQTLKSSILSSATPTLVTRLVTELKRFETDKQNKSKSSFIRNVSSFTFPMTPITARLTEPQPTRPNIPGLPLI